jgi:hypothetical protein
MSAIVDDVVEHDEETQISVLSTYIFVHAACSWLIHISVGEKHNILIPEVMSGLCSCERKLEA